MLFDRINSLLLALSALCAALYLPVAAISSPAVSVVFKCAAILLLLFVAIRARASRLLLGALALGALGDFFLGIPQLGHFGESDLFLFGLASFLVGHLFYVALFLQHRARTPITHLTRLTVLAILAAMWFVLSRTWPALAGMRAPVCIYAAVLATMAITAQYSRLPALVGLGAISFVASDAVLAFTHFTRPLPFSRPFIWFSYYVAQACITIGVATFVMAKTQRARV